MALASCQKTPALSYIAVAVYLLVALKFGAGDERRWIQ